MFICSLQKATVALEVKRSPSSLLMAIGKDNPDQGRPELLASFMCASAFGVSLSIIHKASAVAFG